MITKPGEEISMTRQQCRLINQAILNSTDEWGRGMIYPCKSWNWAFMSYDFGHGEELTFSYNNDLSESTHMVRENNGN